MGVGRFTGLVETCVVCAALQLLRGLKSLRERGGLGRAGATPAGLGGLRACVSCQGAWASTRCGEIACGGGLVLRACARTELEAASALG